MSEERSGSPPERRGRAWLLAGYAQALGAVALATGVSRLLFTLVSPPNLVMTYFMAVTAIAA